MNLDSTSRPVPEGEERRQTSPAVVAELEQALRECCDAIQWDRLYKLKETAERLLNRP